MAQSKKLEIPTPRIFLPLLDPARYKGAHGGRGSAKSHFFADFAVDCCVSMPGFRIVCVREIQRSLKESVKLLLEDKIKGYGLESLFISRTDSIQTPGGGIILFQGMQDHSAQSIKSLEGFHVAYVEEAQTLTAYSLELLRPTIRTKWPNGQGSEIWFSWNPRHASDPVDILLREEKPKDAVVVESNWRDNPFFPDELESEREHDRIHRPDRYAHIWEGAYEPAAVGAIWNRAMFSQHRVSQVPVELGRIVIGVDPPKKSEAGSDEAGIVACGIGSDDRGYVLADASRVASPNEWASAAIGLYDLYEADAIVVEVNNGGEMCKQVLRSIRRSVPVIEVTATRGKHVRAEPIAALYATGRVSHVGAYPEMEGQMCLTTATGYEGEGSPDRMDAAVWCFTQLFPRMTKRSRPRDGVMPSRANNQYRPHRARLH